MQQENKVDWNYALGDLNLLGELERNVIEAYITNDPELYFKWIKAYFHKISSMIDFNRNIFIEKFKEIQSILWGEKEEEDKFIENDQSGRAADIGKCMADLEEIYYKLTEIKVKAGLSVEHKDIVEVEKKNELKKKKEGYPVLDLK